MTSNVIGRAVIVVEAEVDGKRIQGQIEGELGPAGERAAAPAGKRTGWSFMKHVAANLTSNLITKAASAAGNIASQAFSLGFDRLVAIDNARGKLRGLGHDAGSVDLIMKSALNSVKGTAFGLGDAATLAATAVASGIKPGIELENRLKLTGDAATIAGTSLNEMGSIFGKVQTGQKAYTAELNQLADRGIPIYQWLQEELGVSAEALRDMVSKGQVDSETFFRVIQDNIGGAALEAGQTFSGSLENVKAAIGRLGAAFLEPVFEQMPNVFAGLIDVFDRLSPAAEAVGTALGSAFADVVTAVTDLGPKLEAAAGFVERNQVAFGIAAGVITTIFIPAMIRAGVASTVSAAQTVAAWVAKQAAAIAGAAVYVAQSWLVVGSWIRMGAQATISGAITAGQWVAMGARAIAGAAVVVAQTAVVVAQWVAMQVAAGVSAGIQVASNVSTAASFLAVRVAMLAQVAVMSAVRVATVAWTAVQWLLNAALLANPIGLIIVGIAAFIAIIVLAWQNSETFRAIVMAAWEGIKAAALAVVNWFVNSAVPTLQAMWNAIVAGFTWLKDLVIAVVTAMVTGVVNFFTNLWNNLVIIVTAIRDGVVAGWRALQALLIAVVTAIVNWVVERFNWWRDTLTAIVTTIRDWIAERWRALEQLLIAIVTAIVNWVVNKWTTFRDDLVRATEIIRDWIVERFTQLRTKAEEVFDNMVKGIGRIWDGLKAAASAPVRFVVETVLNNGLIAGWNWLVDKLKLPEGLRIGNIPLPAFIHGGVLPGDGTSSGDDMAVINNRGQAVATVASGEPILSRAMYAANRAVVNSILAGKKVAGFFQGGTMPTSGGAVNPHPQPYYDTRYAADMPRPGNTPVYAWHSGTVAQIQRLGTSYGHNIVVNHDPAIGRSRYAHLMAGSIAVAVGQAVSAGMRLAGVGSTGNSTGNHLHFEIIGGNQAINPNEAGGEGGGGGLLAAAAGWILDKLTTPVKAAIDKIPGETMFTDAAKGTANMLLDKAVEKIQELLPTAPMDAGNWADPGGSGVARWRDTVVQALGMVGLPQTEAYISAWLRQIQSESSGNPANVQSVRDINWPNNKAVGLVQLIPGTFAAYRNPSLPNDRTHPLANLYAGMNYAKNRYGVNHLGVIGRGHGYDTGGWLKPGATAAMNLSGKPEPVLTGAQWDNVQGLISAVDARREDEAKSKKGDITLQITYAPNVDPHAVNPRREYENFTHDFVNDVRNELQGILHR